MNQISIFELIDAEDTLSPERQRLRQVLRRGSGYEKGKERIRKYASELNRSDFINELIKEYGYYGCSLDDGFFDCSPKGVVIYDKGFKNEKKYSWITVADEILDMISLNSY